MTERCGWGEAVIASLCRILGSLQVDTDTGAVELGGIRQRALLACLILRPGVVVTFDQLTTGMWGERPPSTARQQIRNVVLQLRRALAERAPDVVIDTDAAGYVLHVDEGAIDAVGFRTMVAAAETVLAAGDDNDEAIVMLGEALALWRGPALAEFDSVDLRSAGEELDEQRLGVIERLAALRLDRGESQALVGELRAMVAQHPLREPLRQLLMTALARCGRQADALHVYERGRRILGDELGIDPGPELHRAYLEILRNEATSDTTPHPVPSFIPGTAADFTGRTTEISALLADVHGAREHAVEILAIDGMGGVGKTTLAIHLARQLALPYPDGQYFIDLRGFSAQHPPLSPEQALEQLLRAAGVRADQIPAGEDLRSQLWRTTTARQRILLVLDNAFDAAQVRPLLPGNGSLVIVTSRRRMLDLDGVTPCSLDLFPHGDAAELFTRIAALRPGDRTEDLDRVVELCGRLPLAIRIAAARYRERTTWSLATLVEKLTDRAGFLVAGDRSVTAALTLSYNCLIPEQQRVFRLLGVYPGPDFDAYSTAALTGTTVAQAEAVLDVLFGDNLLIQRATDRYQLHDLVHDCAGQLLHQGSTIAEQDEAVTRLLDYYLLATHAWCAPTTQDAFRLPDVAAAHLAIAIPAPGDFTPTAARVHTEYPNLVAAVRLAVDWGKYRHAWQIVVALQSHLGRLHFTGEIVDLLALAVAAARADRDGHGDGYGLSAALTLLSFAARTAGDVDRARRCMTEALAISDREELPALRGYQFLFQGSDQLNEQDLRGAWHSFTAAHRIAVRRGEASMYAVTALNLGVVARDAAHFDEALALVNWAATIDNSFPTIRANALVNAGAIRQARGDYPGALRLLEDGLRECREHASTGGVATALAFLSVTHRCLGEVAVAVEVARQAWTAATERNVTDMHGEALNALGEALLAAGDVDAAEDAFADALAAADRNRLPRLTARAHEGFAHVAAARGDLDAAHQHWTTAVDLYPPDVRLFRVNPLAHLDDVDAICERCETGRPGSGRRQAEPIAQSSDWLVEVDELMVIPEPEPPIKGDHR